MVTNTTLRKAGGRVVPAGQASNIAERLDARRDRTRTRGRASNIAERLDARKKDCSGGCPSRLAGIGRTPEFTAGRPAGTRGQHKTLQGNPGLPGRRRTLAPLFLLPSPSGALWAREGEGVGRVSPLPRGERHPARPPSFRTRSVRNLGRGHFPSPAGRGQE